MVKDMTRCWSWKVEVILVSPTLALAVRHLGHGLPALRLGSLTHLEKGPRVTEARDPNPGVFLGLASVFLNFRGLWLVYAALLDRETAERLVYDLT